jgi:hypothetical protein
VSFAPSTGRAAGCGRAGCALWPARTARSDRATRLCGRAAGLGSAPA